MAGHLQLVSCVYDRGIFSCYEAEHGLLWFEQVIEIVSLHLRERGLGSGQLRFSSSIINLASSLSGRISKC